MPLVMPQERDYQIVPAGTHPATCFRVIDIGTQATSFGPKHQVFFSWELTDAPRDDGQLFTISRRYTYSADRKAALRIDVESWLGRGLTTADFGALDLATLLGCSCLLGVKHETRDSRTFANVTSVLKPPPSIPERMPPTNEAISLSLSDRPFAQYDYEALPGWLQEIIARSPEYQLAVNAPPTPIARAAVQAALRIQPSGKKASIFDTNLDDNIPF
jgi:hypothetical protein